MLIQMHYANVTIDMCGYLWYDKIKKGFQK